MKLRLSRYASGRTVGSVYNGDHWLQTFVELIALTKHLIPSKEQRLKDEVQVKPDLVRPKLYYKKLVTPSERLIAPHRHS